MSDLAFLDDLAAAARSSGKANLGDLLSNLAKLAPSRPLEATILAGVLDAAKRGTLDAALTEVRAMLSLGTGSATGAGLSPTARAEIADAALEEEGEARAAALLYLEAAGGIVARVLLSVLG